MNFSNIDEDEFNKSLTFNEYKETSSTVFRENSISRNKIHKSWRWEIRKESGKDNMQEKYIVKTRVHVTIVTLCDTYIKKYVETQLLAVCY